jgi:hypothetical protein
MPDPAGTLNDGGVKFVRQRISAKDINGLVTSYIVKKGSLHAPVKRIVSTDENDVEFKQAFMNQIRSGSLDLQFIAAADKPPGRLQVITVLTSAGINMNVIIAPVDEDFGAGTEAEVKVEIYEEMAVPPEAG